GCRGAKTRHWSGARPALTHIDLDFDHHARRQRLGHLDQVDLDGHALGDLGEIARRVGRGEQRKARGGGAADARDLADEGVVGIGVDLYQYLLAKLQAADLGLLDVDLDPDLVGIVQQKN